MKHALSNFMHAAIIAVLAVGVTLLRVDPAIAQSQAQREQGVSVDVPSEMYIAETAQMRVVIRGSTATNAPVIPEIPGMSVEYRGVNSSTGMTIIINGRVQTSGGEVAHFYSITPKRAGTFTIPVISVDVGGTVLQSKPTQVTVREVPKATDFTLTVKVPKTTVYVGQPVPVLLEWRLGRNVSSPSATLPIDGAAFDTYPDSRIASAPSSPQSEMRIDGERIAVMFSSGVLSTERIIVPRQAGTITIGPARVDFGAAAGQRAPNMMDMPGADRTIYERLYSTAEPIKITVIDLPTEGRPPNFSGLVGMFTLLANVDARAVSVGDPINLAVNISGTAPLAIVPALDLSRAMAGASEFRVPRDPILPTVGATSVAYRTVIRPRSTSATQVGPITLNYFDPETGRYTVAQSTPIELTVAASPSVAIPDEPAKDADSPVFSKPQTPDGLDDIQRIAPAAEHRGAEGVLDRARSPVFLLAAAAPPLSCVLLVGGQFVMWRRSRYPARRRRQIALRRLRTRLRQAAHRGRHDVANGEVGAAIALALAEFVADWFNAPAGALTAQEAISLLSSCNHPSAGRLAELLHQIDAPRFAPTDATGASPTIADVLAAAREFARFAPEPRAEAEVACIG